MAYGDAMATIAAAAGVLAALGCALNGYFVFRLNAKFDRLTGRVDELGDTLRAHVNAPGLHVR